MKDVDIRSIVKLVSDRLKISYMVDETLTGKVTVLGPANNKISAAEAELLLMAILEFKGFSIEYIGEKVRRIVKKDAPNKSAFTPFQKQLPPPAGRPGQDLERMFIQIFKLKHVGVNEILQIIKFLTSPGNTILPYVPGNMFFAVDNELNLRRIAEIIKELDVSGPVRKITSVKVNHAQAKALAEKVTQIITKRAEGEADPGSRESKLAKPALFSDDRTNSILLICLEEDVKTFVALIEQLDVSDVYTPTVKVVHLQYSDAEAVANQVNQAFKVGASTDPAVQFNVIADARTQSLILSSFSGEMLSKVEELVHFLDNPVTPADGVNVHHYRMEYGDATKVEKILSGMESSQGQGKGQSQTKVIADETTNSLIVVASQSKYQDILKLLQKLDTLRPQVLVEGLIVELTQNMANKIGADLNIIPADQDNTRVFGLGNTGAISGFFGGTATGGMHVGVLAPGSFDVNAAAQGNFAERSKIQYLINLFKQDNRSNVLQAPRLMAADNSTAKITVGSKVQVLQGYAQTTQPGQVPIANFTSEDLGLTMEITPRITKGDFISLKLKAEIKGRVEGAEGTISFGPFQQPVFTKTSVENEVVVKDRETLVIGGLLVESKGKQVSKIPGIGDLPIVGKLFQSRNKNSDKKDLLVFLTPHIVRDGFAARRVTKAEEWPLQWRDMPGHTWPHDRGLPVTTQQLQQDVKRSGGAPYRRIFHKAPKFSETFKQ
ncbi:MAG: hypothetical protein HY815_04180 [Candidatus Riflebacteria bacterium]|nr:hypothetical protein [Candidatus Riflebacteria bacterium]